jgi:D-alanine-D-alanine ligase-like ATP-grasp enzyme
MKICVLQVDYSTSTEDYRHYDPHRDLTALLPGHRVDHVDLHKLSVYRQLKGLAREGYDIFVNLCEGYPEWDVPGIEVIDTLERLGLPYTGPTPELFDVPKALMKYVANSTDVGTPAHVIVIEADEIEPAIGHLRFPLFIKPAHAGDSRGVDQHSLAHHLDEALPKIAAIVAEFGEALVEEYIDGREFTVLAVAGADEGDPATALTPVEFIFPPGYRFKTYELKTSELHPEANIPVRDPELAARLRDAAVRVFTTFGGVGYSRMDFRLDAQGKLYFLELNFTCSVFYTDGWDGSAEYILKYDPMGPAGFAERIIAEGLGRYRRKQNPYVVRGNSVAGYGIFANRDIAEGGLVFRGEGRTQRIVTRRHVATWSADEQRMFYRYGYPLSDEVFMLWDRDPAQWAPQNHSCDANTRFEGLHVVASRAIRQGEELTLDYATFMNEVSEPFACTCGASSCRGTVSGTPGNSVTLRERGRRGGR